MIRLQDFCLLTGEFADKTSHLLDTLLMWLRWLVKSMMNDIYEYSRQYDKFSYAHFYDFKEATQHTEKLLMSACYVNLQHS